MDPVTVGLLAAVAVFITLLSYALFRYFNAESDFEKAYGANALKLLSEEKTGKPKSAKTSKTKSKGSDKKKETSGASSDREAERKHESGHKQSDKQSDESVAVVGEPVGEGSSKGAEVVTSEVKHKKKKQKSDEAKPTEGVEVEKENKAPTPERFVEHLPQEKMPQTDASFEEAVPAEGSEKKSSRKKKYRRADESTKEQLGGAKQKLGGETTPPPDSSGKDFSTTEQQILHSEVEKEAERIHKKNTTVPLTTEPVVQQKTQSLMEATAMASAPPAAFINKEEKPKVRTASISLKDITIDKLHSRLSSIAELESEYVSFLTRFFSDNTAQKMKLSKEVGTLREQLSEKVRLAEQISNALTEEKKKVVASEKSANNIRAAFVQEKKSFVRAQDQLKAENSSLKDELQKLKAQSVKAAPPPVDITPFQKQIDGLRSELNANKVLFTKMETELAQKGQALLKAEQDFQACGGQLEQVKKENAALQKRILDADAAAKAEHGMMEAELNNASKGMMELEQLVSKLQNEMANRASALDSEAKTLQADFKGLSDLRTMLLGENRRLKDKMATTESEARESLAASGRERKRLADERKAADARCDEALAKLAVKQTRILELEKEKAESVASFNVEKAANEKKIAHQKAMMHILELRAQKIGKEMDKVIAEKEEEIQSLRDVVSKTNKPPASEPVNDSCQCDAAEGGVDVSTETPPLPAGGDIASLLRELDDQKARNNELRNANYKILDISQKQEENLSARVAQIELEWQNALRLCFNETVKTLSSILPPELQPEVPKVCGVRHFSEFITQVAEALKTLLAAPASHSNASTTASVDELENSLEEYRVALADLSSKMTLIESKLAVKDKEHKNEVEKLMKDVKQRDESVNEKQIRGDQISEEKPKEGGEPTPRVDSSKGSREMATKRPGSDEESGGRRSAEDEWEVVE